MMHKYRGVLDFYFATGEGPFPMFIAEHPEPDIWKRTYVFSKKESPFLTIKHPRTKEIVFEGAWQYSRDNTLENNYYPSPEAIDPKLWLEFCQKQYLAEINLPYPLDADLSSLSISFLVDVWAVSSNEKTLKASGCRIYPIIEGKNVEVSKPKFKWVSPEVVKNFKYLEKEKKAIVFTKEHQYIIELHPEVIDELKTPNEFHQPREY